MRKPLIFIVPLFFFLLGILLLVCSEAYSCESFEECMEYSKQLIGKTNYDGHNQSLQFTLRAIAYKLEEIHQDQFDQRKTSEAIVAGINELNDNLKEKK